MYDIDKVSPPIIFMSTVAIIKPIDFRLSTDTNTIDEAVQIVYPKEPTKNVYLYLYFPMYLV